MSTPEKFAAALKGVTPDQLRQAEFITDLCNQVRDHVLTLVPRMPSHWNGHQLRQLIAEKFGQEVSSSMSDKRSRTYKEYESERYRL